MLFEVYRCVQLNMWSVGVFYIGGRGERGGLGTQLFMLVLYCMQFVMSVFVVSMVAWCGVVSWCDVNVGYGDVLEVFVCILRSCISVLSVSMTCGLLICVNVVSDLM